MNSSFALPECFIWDNRTKNIRLLINGDDVKLSHIFDNLTQTISGLGLTFKTGPVVDFRVKDTLNDVENYDSVPLIGCANFNNTYIRWPLNSKKIKQYLTIKDNKSILLPIDDYILVKRFPSKEEGKNLHLNILLKKELGYEFLGIENHVNYLRFFDEDKRIMKGIFISLNSTFYNRYFKITNGTTQINVTDLNNLPVLPLKLLEEISKVKLNYDELTTDICGSIIIKYLL